MTRDDDPSWHWVQADLDAQAERERLAEAHRRRQAQAREFEAELAAHRADPVAQARASWWRELQQLDAQARDAWLAGDQGEARRLRLQFRELFRQGVAAQE